MGSNFGETNLISPCWFELLMHPLVNLVKLLVCVVYAFLVQLLGDIGKEVTLIIISKFGLQLSSLASLLVLRGSLLRVKPVAPVLQNQWHRI